MAQRGRAYMKGDINQICWKKERKKKITKIKTAAATMHHGLTYDILTATKKYFWFLFDVIFMRCS